MSETYIPAELRRLVRQRAQARCEYCLLPESLTYYGCQVDHVIAEKHLGATEEANLAYSCAVCNRNKGSDIASLTLTDRLTRLFHPRTDEWEDHFRFDSAAGLIETYTDVGEVTARLLGFNSPERIAERSALHAAGAYPPPESAPPLTA